MKKKIVAKRKRPKAVMRKAWATRRLKAEFRSDAEFRADLMKAADVMSRPVTQRQDLTPEARASLAKGTLTSETAIPRSDKQPDAIAALLDQFRDEQLCAFVAEMAMARHVSGANSHQPIIVSRPQAEAIEEYLTMQGFSPFGRAKIVKADQ